MATRHHQWRETTVEDMAAVCRWLASQVRRLLKRVEMLEHPRLALKPEVLADLSRQRTEAGRLAAEAARRVAAGEPAVKQAEQLAGTEERILALNTELPEKDEVTPVVGGHRVEGAKWTCESLKRRKAMWRFSQGKSEIHVATSRVKSLPVRKDMTSNATLRSEATPPRRRGQLRPARGRNGRAWEGRFDKDCGVRRAERRCHRHDVHSREAPERD